MKQQIFILICLTVILIGCHKKDKPVPSYLLTNVEKAWNIYNLNDTIKYLSNHGNLKTYIVSNITDEIKPKYSSMVMGYVEFNYEELHISFNRIDSFGKASLILSKFEDPQNINTNGVFDISGFWDGYNCGIFSLIYFTTTIDSLVVESILYDSVIVVDRGCNSVDELGRSINKLYYKKEKGLLRFDNLFGEIWERQE